MLDRIKIASPRTADWEQMKGTDRVRFCGECRKNVFNLSAMTRREAGDLLKQTNGNLCARLYRRADGTVLTEDCPVGLRVKVAKVRRRIGWAVAGALSLSTAWAQDGAAVAGSVRKSDGTLAAKTTILITGDRFTLETMTDNRGIFSATELAPGKYVIAVAGSPVKEVELRSGDAVEFVIQQAFTPSQANMGEVAVLRRKPWWRRVF